MTSSNNDPANEEPDAPSSGSEVRSVLGHIRHDILPNPTEIAPIRELIDAYRFIDKPFQTYVTTMLAPAFIAGAIAITIASVLSLPTLITAPLYLIGVFLPGVVVFYPKMIHDRKAKEITERFHFFITHLTVLAMTNTDRVEVFRQLAKVEEYEALAEEAGALVALVDTWNQSLDDAAMRRSKRAPGELLPAFYERLAYNIGAGQTLHEFLVEEQDVIIQNFSTRYQADLERLEVLSDLYMSIMLSTTFAFVLAVMIPFLTGIDPVMILSGIGAMALIVQFAFVMLIHAKAPEDPLWVEGNGMDVPYRRFIKFAITVGGVVSLIATALVAYWWTSTTLLNDIPRYIRVAIPTLPLLFPGIYIMRVESQIESRDEQFPAFIRSLGSIEAIKQTATSNVLSTIRHKDFGDLTMQIDTLYRRLNIRVNSEKSWKYFAVETGSYLIDKFSNMYVLGRKMGGDPKEIGMIINNNFREVLKLREYREQQATTLLGKVYGMTAASTFAYMVGVEVVRILVKMMRDVQLPGQFAGSFLFAGIYNMTTIEVIVVAVLLLHAVLSAVLIRLSARRHLGGATLHFTLLTWLTMIVAAVTKRFVTAFVSVN